MADRALLLSHLGAEGRRGFEIGALLSPFLPKAQHDVTLVDRLSTPALREHYAGDPNVDVASIAEVDVVVRDGALHEALAPLAGGGFDYAIASHVIEHVPDIVMWLNDIARLVRPGGRLLLVVPDKRYTFDYLRELSTVSEMVDAYARRSTRPSPRQVFDFNAHAAEVDKRAAWAGPLDPAALRRYSTPGAALELALESHRDERYVDSHCWVFTPAGFLGACAELAELGLLRWRLAFLADTRRDEEDFGLVLERPVADGEAGGNAESFRAALRHVA